MGVSPFQQYVVRSFLLRGGEVLPRPTTLSSSTTIDNRKKTQARKTKSVTWLPSLRSERRILQRHRQLTPTPYGGGGQLPNSKSHREADAETVGQVIHITQGACGEERKKH